MEQKSTQNIKLAFLLNLIFSIIELVGGILTNSISIISDSVHDFGDAISIGISFFLEKKSEKEPDEKYTYGYKRYSILGAFITSIILLIGAIFVFYNAIIRLMNPAEVKYDGMIILAVLGLIINGIGSYKTAKSERINEKAVSLHLLEDVLGWAAVLIGSICMKIFNLPIIDPILSILIGIYILMHVVENLKEIANIFLEKAPSDIDINNIKEELKSINIKDIHHVHLWTLDGVDKFITAHIVINEKSSKEDIIKIKKDVRNILVNNNIMHSTLEIEYELEECNSKKCNNG